MEHEPVMPTAKGRMRYLIGLLAMTLIGCASSHQPQGKHAEDETHARPSFVGHWNNEDPSKDIQPANLDIHPDGTFAGAHHDADHFKGKWTATSKTSATFTEDDDTEVVTGQLSGDDEMVILAAGEQPMKFKRQR
jgi:hypothetical protein